MLLAALLLSFPLLALQAAPELGLEQALPLLLQALQGGPGALALGVGALIVALLQVVKRYGPALHPALAQPNVVRALALVLPVVSAVVLHLSTGGVLTLVAVGGVVLHGLVQGLVSIGLFEVGKGGVALARPAVPLTPEAAAAALPAGVGKVEEARAALALEKLPRAK